MLSFITQKKNQEVTDLIIWPANCCTGPQTNDESDIYIFTDRSKKAEGIGCGIYFCKLSGLWTNVLS